MVHMHRFQPDGRIMQLRSQQFALWHFHTVLLHQLHLLIFPLLGLYLNLKFQRSFSVVLVPTSNLSPILSQPGSLKNVLQFSFLQLPTSSISSSGQFHPILKQSNIHHTKSEQLYYTSPAVRWKIQLLDRSSPMGLWRRYDEVLEET